jgi:hypothetical protein
MLDNSAIPDSLNTYPPQGNLFPRGRHTCEGTEMRAPHFKPSNHDVPLGYLPLNRHDHIRVTMLEREQMLTGLLNPCDARMMCHVLRCQKLRQAIHRTLVA